VEHGLHGDGGRAGSRVRLPRRKDQTRWRYQFAPESGGCAVTESFEIVRTPGAVGRFLTKIGTGVPWSEREADLVRGMEETLRRLKAVAEVAQA
jgi:hypothetical protein